MTREEIIRISDKYRILFLLFVVGLKMERHNTFNKVTSHFTGKANAFTIFSWLGRYWHYKDTSLGGETGDIFNFIARLYNLNIILDFPKIFQIAVEKLLEAGIVDNPDSDSVYKNKTSGDLLRLSVDSGKYFIPKQFKDYHPIFSEAGSPDMAIVKSFTYTKGKKEITHKHDWSKLNESLFSIPVNEDRYFILYNPISRQYHEWGVKNSTDIVGWKQAMYNAYICYPDTCNTLFVTNTIEGLLNFQSLALPTIAFIKKGEELPPFFHHVIRPRFSKIVLLYNETKEEKNHIDNIANQMGVQPSTLQYKLNDKWIVEPDHSAYFKSYFEKNSSLDYVFGLMGERLPVELDDYIYLIEKIK